MIAIRPALVEKLMLAAVEVQMVENSKLYFSSCAEQCETEEIGPKAPPPPAKISFFERFFIHANDVLVGLTAALKVPHSSGGPWDMPR